MHGARRHDGAEHVDSALMYVSRHFRDVPRRQTVLLDDREQSVRRRVGMAAGRVVLERSLGDGPAVAETVDQTRGIGVARHARRHALGALKDVGRALKTVGGELGGHQAVRGGHRRVELFRIGGVAQEFPQAACLRARRAERIQHLRRRQTKQTPSGRRSGHGAGRASGVKHLVVRTAEKLSDANAHLVTRHCRRDELTPRRAVRLRQRKRYREHHRRRMKYRAVVHIVLLGEVRCGAVHHRGKIWRRAGAVDQDLARIIRLAATGLARKTGNRLNWARAFSGERRT